jgi:Na+-driven multidrug efflux pump
MGLVYILTSFGSAAVAGNTIGIRIIIFACLPAWGVSNAAATLVGQNLGAGKPDRAEAAAIKAAWYNAACLGIVGVVFFAFAPQIVALFSRDPEVAAYGSRCLRIVSAGFPFYGFAYVMIAAFNGAGDTRTPTWINIACLWLWEIPLAWALAHPAGFGPTGVFIACAVAFTTMALVSTALFHRGTWKTRRV